MYAPTSAIHWGTPSPQFNERETTKVYWHGFTNRFDADSSEFTCLGHRWRLEMHPYEGIHPAPGENEDAEEYVVLNLSHLSFKNTTIDYCVSIKNSEDKVVATRKSILNQHTFIASDRKAIDIWQFADDDIFYNSCNLRSTFVRSW
jgi:hypothetical protein